jgi:hypothetical protein
MGSGQNLELASTLRSPVVLQREWFWHTQLLMANGSRTSSTARHSLVYFFLLPLLVLPRSTHNGVLQIDLSCRRRLT